MGNTLCLLRLPKKPRWSLTLGTMHLEGAAPTNLVDVQLTSDSVHLRGCVKPLRFSFFSELPSYLCKKHPENDFQIPNSTDWNMHWKVRCAFTSPWASPSLHATASNSSFQCSVCRRFALQTGVSTNKIYTQQTAHIRFPLESKTHISHHSLTKKLAKQCRARLKVLLRNRSSYLHLYTVGMICHHPMSMQNWTLGYPCFSLCGDL